MNKRPELVISSLDADRLDKLLNTLPHGAFPGIDDLEAELARADVVAPEDVPPDVMTMNSTARFTVDSSAKEFCLTLVYPEDVDGSGSRISILAPVGSALLGLSQGDQISWPRPGGGELQVRLEEIIYQPERVGEYRV